MAPRVVTGTLSLTLMLTAASAGADFGVLFFSRAQRAAIDQSLAGAREAAASPPPAAAPQRIDGILRRPDGRDTVWLDGTPTAQPAGLRFAPARALALIPDGAPTARLRVGDRWPPASDAPEDPSPEDDSIEGVGCESPPPESAAPGRALAQRIALEDALAAHSPPASGSPVLPGAPAAPTWAPTSARTSAPPPAPAAPPTAPASEHALPRVTVTRAGAAR